MTYPPGDGVMASCTLFDNADYGCTQQRLHVVTLREMHVNISLALRYGRHGRYYERNLFQRRLLYFLLSIKKFKQLD